MSAAGNLYRRRWKKRGLADGRTSKEIADALGRDIEDVRETAAVLGNGVPLAPRLWPPTS